jgi:hypothetical protein
MGFRNFSGGGFCDFSLAHLGTWDYHRAQMFPLTKGKGRLPAASPPQDWRGPGDSPGWRRLAVTSHFNL